MFPKHPLSYDTTDLQHAAAKAMLVTGGKIVGRVWAVDETSIAFTTSQGRAMTAYIERSDDDQAWILSPFIAAGWPVTDK